VKNCPFQIEESILCGVPVQTFTNKGTHEKFSVIPQSGGRLKELWLNNGRECVSVLRTIEDIHSELPNDIFLNAKLSPYAGRVKDGRYTVNDVLHELQKNYTEENNAAHGFIYNKAFTVIGKEIKEDHALCSLRYDYNGDVKGYPFPYTIEISYSLTMGSGLICTTRVINRSHVPIPLGDGWHHYFDIGCRVDEVKLKLDVTHQVELDPRKIPTGCSIPFDEFYEPRKISDRFFDSCFRARGNQSRVETQLLQEDRHIDLRIWQDVGEKKYNYLVVYTPPDRKSIAIEPMTSNVNSFNTGDGLIVLSPGDEYVSNFGVYMVK